MSEKIQFFQDFVALFAGLLAFFSFFFQFFQFFGQFFQDSGKFIKLFKFGSSQILFGYSQILDSTLDFNALYGLRLGNQFGPSVAKSRVWSSSAKIFLIFLGQEVPISILSVTKCYLTIRTRSSQESIW